MHAFYLYRTSENYLEQLQKPITMSVYYRQNIIYTPKKEIPKQAVLTRLFYLLTENEKLRIVLRKKVNISGKASDLMHDMPYACIPQQCEFIFLNYIMLYCFFHNCNIFILP